MKKNKCKICRRAGQKLFLKGERCVGQKCAMIRRPYPSGSKGKRRKSPLSEYGKQLREKQKIRFSYGLGERQFKKYAKECLARVSKEGMGFVDFLVERLESRLDNAVFRAGLANSRSKARFFVTHGHFLVNKKRVDLPSYRIKKGDIISIREKSQKKAAFKELSISLKKHQLPSWLQANQENLEIKVVGAPSKEEFPMPGDLQKVGEFYSR